MTDIHPTSLPQDTKNTRTTGPEVWASIDDPDAVKPEPDPEKPEAPE